MKNAKLNVISIFFIIIFSVFIFPNAIFHTQAAGNTYYVSTSGNDTLNNGLSSSTPWKTVSKVNSFNLQPGDTVLFNRGNTWNEQLVPKSGTGESTRITYGAYGSGNNPVINNAYFNNKSYITVTYIDFKSTNSSVPVYVTGSDHITWDHISAIAQVGSGSRYAFDVTINSTYNVLTNSNIQNYNTAIQCDTLNLNSNANYNRIEGNTIGGATHYALALEGATGSLPTGVASFNVIRNNIINNTAGAQLGLQSYAGSNLIDGNTIVGGFSSPFLSGTRSFKLVTTDNIVRRNVIRDNNSSDSYGLGLDVYNYGSIHNFATGNRVYNNIVTNITRGVFTFTNYAGDTSVGIYNNYFKNNIVYENVANQQFTANPAPYNVNVHDNYFTNNLFYKTGQSAIIKWNGTVRTVAQQNAAEPTYWQGNIQVNPNLDSTYHPTASSPVIDSGSFLTTITSSSGTGSSLVVADAKYFFDGYGIVTGDTIQVGSQLATITAINYTTNTLTLDRSVSWTQNQGISLPYNGSKPDIGVYEYGGVTTPTPTPAPSFSKCDQNHDTSINVLDLQSLANVILGKTTCSFTCDLNQDGSTNVLDLQYLANVILGKSSCQ